jgi:hypothetical protein
LEDKNNRQPARARRLFLRVIKDHPRSKWAKMAAERLKELGDG